MFENTQFLPALMAIIVVIVYLIGAVYLGKKKNTQKRLQTLLDTPNQMPASDEEFIDSLRSDNAASPLAQTIGDIFTKMGIDTERVRARNQLRFYQAGIHSPDAHIYYLLFTRFFSIIFVATALYIVSQNGAGLSDYVIGLVLVLIGIFGADGYIRNLTDKRKQKLIHSFPDALDLLLACVESGLALDGALSRVCKELGTAHPILTYELNRTRMELSLLNDRAKAITNLADRNGLLSFKLFSAALLQSEKFGTSLTDTLRVMSEEYRTQRLMNAEEKAGRLPALMTIPLMMFLLPALFIIILGPAIIDVVSKFK